MTDTTSSDTAPTRGDPASGDAPPAGPGDAGTRAAADPASRAARGPLTSMSESNRSPIASGGSETRTPIASGGGETRTPIASGGGETRTPIASGGSNRPDAPPAAEGREGTDRVTHPPDGVGYRFDSAKTDVEVLNDRLSSLPGQVQGALKQGGDNVKVEITAGASRAGPPAYNEALSAARGADMAAAMRDLGVKADITVNAVGEKAAAKAGAPDNVDNPEHRVATFKVEVEQRAPQAPSSSGGQATSDASAQGKSQEPEAAADKKAGPEVKFTVDKKWGVAEPGGESKASVSAKAPVASGEFDESASTSAKSGDLSGEAKAGSWGKADAGVKVGDKGVGVYGEAEAKAGAQAKGQFDIGEHASVSGTGFVGGKAKAVGEASFGPKGVAVGAKGEAFAGGSAGVEGKVGGDLAGASGGVEGLAGIGAKGDLKVQVGLDKVGFSFKGGAAFGLGASVSFGFSFSPTGIASEVKGAATDTVKGISDLAVKLMGK